MITKAMCEKALDAYCNAIGVKPLKRKPRELQLRGLMDLLKAIEPDLERAALEKALARASGFPIGNYAQLAKPKDTER